MSNKVLCTLRDVKAGNYYSPVMLNSSDEFQRTIRELVNAKVDVPVSKFPEDFQLYLLACFDESTGLISVLQSPEFICNASDLVSKVQLVSDELEKIYPSNSLNQEALAVS